MNTSESRIATAAILSEVGWVRSYIDRAAHRENSLPDTNDDA
jgi:hypothetical protein